MLSFEIRQSDRSGQHGCAPAQLWVWVSGVAIHSTDHQQAIHMGCATIGDGLHNIKVQAWRFASRWGSLGHVLLGIYCYNANASLHLKMCKSIDE